MRTGIRTFETKTRNTLDVTAIPMMHELSHLPIIMDPSHAAGMSHGSSAFTCIRRWRCRRPYDRSSQRSSQSIMRRSATYVQTNSLAL